MSVQIHAEDPEREAVTYRYQWYVNNAPLSGQTNAMLPAELLRRGQMVSVEIIPADATQKGEAYRTTPVVVGNSVPRVTVVTLAPLTARPGERLEAHAEASDPDYDRVDMIYRWFRNASAVKEGDEPFLDTTGFAARDQIVVEVTAQDPAASGNVVRSAPVTLGNRPPKIASVPPVPSSADYYEYAVRAIDPDGDRMTYQLEAGPVGMTIGEESGRVTWAIPTNSQGIFHVKVIANDGQGGTAFQEYDLTFTAGSPPKPPGA